MAFGAKKTCPICGGNIKGLFNTKIKDKVTICVECRSKANMDFNLFELQDVDDMKRHLEYREKNKIKYENFKTTRELKVHGYYFREDSNNKLWYYSIEKNPVNPPLFQYSEIADYEYAEDGETITKGGIGSAVVGGALFGVAGAMVGGITGKKKSKTEVTKMTVRLSLTNPYHNSLEINFASPGASYKVGSFLYNQSKAEAMSLISFLDSIAHKATVISAQQTSSEAGSSADEILKYKNLLDMGAITQEEYDKKKEQLLGL